MKHFKISFVGLLCLFSIAFCGCIKKGLLPSLESKATVVKQTNSFRLFSNLINIKGSLIPFTF